MFEEMYVSYLNPTFNSRMFSPKKTTEEKGLAKIQKGDIKFYEDVLTAEDFEEDIDGDGQKERITLNISPAPQPHPKNEGQYLWDSSHVWQLIVEDEGDYFTLFDDHVQGWLKCM